MTSPLQTPARTPIPSGHISHEPPHGAYVADTVGETPEPVGETP